jgi:peptidoglycan/xylan/chitin deacetylase (PgdA/CDA1 family)
MDNGKFIISLDFELHWGAVEKYKINSRKEYFDITRKSIPKVLDLFKQYDIHATWATVGFLFAKNKKQLLEFLPEQRPSYVNKKLSYYFLIDNEEVGKNEDDDPYHFASSLIHRIINTPNQELASHTFSHYYCNEKGQKKEQFDADLNAVQKIAKENFNIELKSLVFPRNQLNKDYLAIVKKHGIKVVRSKPNVWFWNNSSSLMSLPRAFDTLTTISNTLTFQLDKSHRFDGLLLLPASRFLRPFSNKEKMIQKLKVKRIKKEMTTAAKNNRSYHLWWHPHNFGYFVDENMTYLEDILKHYKDLKEIYNFESNSMIEMYT